MSVSCPGHRDHCAKRDRLRRLLHTAGLLLLPLLVASCDQQSLPAAPSEVTSGVTLYEHANYLGDSALLTRSSDDLRDYAGPCAHSDSSGTTGVTTFDWEDCISAVRIAPGWRATLYRNRNYK